MTHPPVSIRRASISDADLLAQLGARTFADTFAADNSPEDMSAYLTTAFSPALQATELSDPQTTFLIAEVDGQAAGYAKLQRGEAPGCVQDENAFELARLYVERRYHGCGVGGALMQECLAEGRKAGAKTLWLGVWEHNPRARVFYRKWGFQERGKHKFRLGSDTQTDVVLEYEL